jgi:chromosome partitioning protein
MSQNAMTGDELRQFREARGISQAELAELLNEALSRHYDRNRVSRWETGAERIPRSVIVTLRGMAGGAPSGIPAAAAGPATVVVWVNQKGGVGKTTSAVNVAFLLAKAGKRVLVVDCDPQGNATIHFGVDPHEREVAKRTLTHVLFGPLKVPEATITVCGGIIDLLPSSITLSNADAELTREPNGNLILREKIDDVRNAYDFVMLDCPPNLGQVTVSALNAADQVVIPSQTEMLSIMGIPMLLETLSKVRRRVNPRIAILGILPTLHKARRVQDQAMVAELRQLAASHNIRLFDVVRDAPEYSKGVAAGVPGLVINPAAAGADAYQQVTQALLALPTHKRTADAAA